MTRSWIDFGIDLGTTNSTIAVIDGIDAKVIPNKGGSGTTPSAVWIDKRGREHVGEEAKERALTTDQDNGDLEFKLRMGMGSAGKKVFARSERELLPEELSAEVLKSLKTDVQSTMGEELRAAVITVPAAFENPSTTATRKAAELIGLTQSPLLLEPVAASLAYGFQSESENVYWFVYDFGGGTFDAAVMRIRDGLIQVVEHDGDNYLGGKNIDWAIVERTLIPALTEQFNLPDFRRGNKRWRNEIGILKYYAERAKIEVCRTRAPCDAEIEGVFVDADGKEVDFEFTLTPEDVQRASKPWIEKSLGLCRKTLKEAGLSGSDMERILMVGGTTLDPWVREAVQAELGSQVEFGIDPVTVVARGAAIFASTQALKADGRPAEQGTWTIGIEHKPVGNVPDPDIGGRVESPDDRTLEGYTIEFIDSKTQWRSGRIVLGAAGVFMTQLYAEKQRRHEYAIELCDPTGTRLPTAPDRVTYTLGVLPEENPPAAMTLGVGLASGAVATYIKKGTRLPAHRSMDHYSALPLRAGNPDDALRIPLLEGTHGRAERNHCIGVMRIRGTDIPRDLPAGSPIDITLLQDASQQIRVQVYVNTLDLDFDLSFDPQRLHKSLTDLRQAAEEQRTRLAGLREEAERTDALRARAALSRIEEEELQAHVESLIDAAEDDPDALAQLDRRVRELAAAVDEVEDSVEWPILLADAEKARESTAEVVNEYGDAGDRARLQDLENELQRAIDAGDPDHLRRHIDELEGLSFRVLDGQAGFHLARFNWLVERTQSMRDPAQAEQVIAQGRRAINVDDIDALKAANRQLISLLPRDVQEASQHINVGDTVTR